MRLKNKKTGDIAKIIALSRTGFTLRLEDTGRLIFVDSIRKLNEEWEDYEEPKEYWYIDADGGLLCEPSDDRCEFDNKCRKIGNYFETKEEAEQAVEKLKAWKRLKDKGFKFNGVTPMEYFIRFTYDKPRQILDNQQRPEVAQQFNKDLDLLFGGEE